jgi:uroporphyrinogen decarboxylase
MNEHARLLRDTYAVTPGARLVRREFGYYCLERWHEQGLDREADLSEVFDYDPGATYDFYGLGWCEAAFQPAFEDKVLEDRGDYELVQDWAGRGVLVFKGRRSGFMPEYVDHPVKDMATWEANCKWRMDPESPSRWEGFDDHVAGAKKAAGEGMIIRQLLVGGYMYLRSLIGPTDLMYAWYDMPEVIHDCMQTWLELADVVSARAQEHVTFDEVFFAEDICYNTGPLCSPETMKEFLLPYYQQLLTNIKARQIDRARHLYVQVDTDGLAPSVIDIYRESIGMDVMSPFEVASGCDVVEIGGQYPDLVIFGGIDKRVLATTPKEIDKMLERILPPMRERGGYIPTCDHGVPEEVSLANYLHYRKRCVELGG